MIHAVMRDLAQRGARVEQVVPKPASARGYWSVEGHARRADDDVGRAGLIVQRGLPGPVLDLLVPWRERCVNDPVATAEVHDRAGLMRTLASAGIAVPDTQVEHDYDAACATGGVIKAVDAQAGRGATVLLPGSAPSQSPFAGPYLVQQHAQGWEAKLYVLGSQVRAVRRGPEDHTGGELYRPTPEHARLALDVAAACGLEMCGVDAIVTLAGPLVIDVNPFPSAVKIPGAAAIMSEYLYRRW